MMPYTSVIMFDTVVIGRKGKSTRHTGRARPRLRWWWWFHFIIVTLVFLTVASGPWLAALNAMSPGSFAGVARVLAAVGFGGVLFCTGWACVVIPTLEATFPVVPERATDRRARFAIANIHRLVFSLLIPPLLITTFGRGWSDVAFWSALVGVEGVMVVLWWWSGRLFARRAARTHAATNRHCEHCEYDLSGHDHQQCPECGAAIAEPLQSEHADSTTPPTADQPDRGR